MPVIGIILNTRLIVCLIGLVAVCQSCCDCADGRSFILPDGSWIQILVEESENDSVAFYAKGSSEIVYKRHFNHEDVFTLRCIKHNLPKEEMIKLITIDMFVNNGAQEIWHSFNADSSGFLRLSRVGSYRQMHLILFNDSLHVSQNLFFQHPRVVFFDLVDRLQTFQPVAASDGLWQTILREH